MGPLGCVYLLRLAALCAQPGAHCVVRAELYWTSSRIIFTSLMAAIILRTLVPSLPILLQTLVLVSLMFLLQGYFGPEDAMSRRVAQGLSASLLQQLVPRPSPPTTTQVASNVLGRKASSTSTCATTTTSSQDATSISKLVTKTKDTLDPLVPRLEAWEELVWRGLGEVISTMKRGRGTRFSPMPDHPDFSQPTIRSFRCHRECHLLPREPRQGGTGRLAWAAAPPPSLELTPSSPAAQL